MQTLPRRSLLMLASSLILVGSVFGLRISSPARADVGVRPILPGGSSLKPDEETPIQMAAETIVMNVRPATEADNAAVELNPEAYGLQFQPVWFSAIAEVEADFTMQNPTSDPVSLTAWFPLASALENVGWELNPDEIVPRLESFQVAVDGTPLDYTVSELPNPKGQDKPPLPWASFPVAFPAGRETNIHVRYVLPLHQAVKGSELALYYIFQTGAGWAGPIGQAELIVNLPYPASAETLAGMPSGSFNLPYFISNSQAGLPPGAVLEGDQARWTWVDLEPGPKDDFSIWLMDPGKYQELETARTAAQANPQDGQAWLNLASIYRSLATMGHSIPSIFSASYLEPGLAAYRKAAGLLPEHPTPHAGLALLTLAPYMRAKDAPPEVIQSVQDELKTARDLEAKNPSLAEEAGHPSWMVEDMLNIYSLNDATATAEAAFWAAEQATQTAAVAGPQTSVPGTALAQAPTRTATPTPSKTTQPKPAPSQTLAPPTTMLQQTLLQTGFGLTYCIILAGGIVFLVIVGYLALRRRPRR